MPYRIRFYPKGATRRRLLRNAGVISSTTEILYGTRKSAKNSYTFRDLKERGLSPRVEKTRRKK